MLSINHMQGESMSFEELNVSKNHVYFSNHRQLFTKVGIFQVSHQPRFLL